MTVEACNSRIYEVIRASTETELALCEDTHLITQMGLSSVEVMLLLSDLEDAFDIDLPISELRNVATVGQLCQVVRQIMGVNG